MDQRSCVMCQTALTGRQTKYCGRTCAIKSATTVRRTTPRSRSARRSEYASCICVQCGATWRASRAESKLCSPECRSEYYRAIGIRIPDHAREPRLCHLPTDHPVMWCGRADPVWFRSCDDCGSLFTCQRENRLYCSATCRGRAKLRRRNQARGVFDISRADRLAIYERDGWICQLCLEAVDPDLHYLDDWAASLDHIVCQSTTTEPDHSPANLRLAHRWCNTVRGDGSRDTSGLFAVA
jgi:hypothetical protein